MNPGIEDVAAQIEGLGERGLPFGLIVLDQYFESFATGLGFVPVLDLHALAVVDENQENVLAGTCAVSGPERFEQAEDERENAEGLEGARKEFMTQERRRGSTVGPYRSRERDQKERESGNDPVSAGKQQGCNQGFSEVLSSS